MKLAKERHEATTKEVLLRAGLPIFVVWSLIPLTFLLPLVNSTKAPYFDLTRIPAQVAYWVSLSGSKYGVPIIAISMLAIFISRSGITGKRRWMEACFAAIILILCAGGGSAINEHVIKEQLRIPRPNIIWLAGEDGAGPLGMTPECFYSSGTKGHRSILLAPVLQHTPPPIPLSPLIKDHWIKETGYSLPSGHSFSAMFLASFFLMVTATYVTTKRFLLFYTLLPWALAVCYSRPILRVHTPTDITIGGLLGVIVAFAGWLVFRSLIRRSFQ